MKNLVVYFSHEGQNSVDFNVQNINKGHTRIVAEKIALKLNADLFRIVPKDPYPKDYDECVKRAKNEYENNICPEIELPLPEGSNYNTVYLGFPIWFRTFPGVVSTFINGFDFENKTVKPFCTNEEGAFGIAEFELENLIKKQGGKTEHGLVVRGSQVNNCDEILDKWLKN